MPEPATIETTARDVTPPPPPQHETGPRAIPRDAAIALFAQWYDAHEADADATFRFVIKNEGRHMDVETIERVQRSL